MLTGSDVLFHPDLETSIQRRIPLGRVVHRHGKDPTHHRPCIPDRGKSPLVALNFHHSLTRQFVHKNVLTRYRESVPDP